MIGKTDSHFQVIEVNVEHPRLFPQFKLCSAFGPSIVR